MEDLSSIEKRFLANDKMLNRQFGEFAPLARSVYEFCRRYVSKDAIWTRFRAARLAFKKGFVKKHHLFDNNSASQCEGQLFGVVNIRHSDGYDKEANSAVLERLLTRTRPPRVHFNNSMKYINIHGEKIFYFNKRAARNDRKNLTNDRFAEKSSPVLYGALVQNSLVQTMVLHKIFYHALGHALVARDKKVLNNRFVYWLRDLPRETTEWRSMQIVSFVGQDPICGDLTNVEGDTLERLWENNALKTLEEGVVENFALECIADEFLVGGNCNSVEFEEINALIKQMQRMPNSYVLTVLVGLWNSISEFDLLKQYLGQDVENEAVWESTAIFKKCYEAFVESMIEYSKDVKNQGSLDENKAQKIAQTYCKCVKFCEEQAIIWCIVNSGRRSKAERYNMWLELAKNMDKLGNYFANVIHCSGQELTKFVDILVQEMQKN